MIFYSYTVDVEGLNENEVIKRAKGSQNKRWWSLPDIDFRLPGRGKIEN